MADSAKGKEEFSDLIQRLAESIASISDRLPFEIDRQKLRSITAFAALSITIIFAWKLLSAPSGNQRRQPRRRNSGSGTSGARSLTNATLSSSELCSPSGNSRALDAVDEFFRPVKLTFEQRIRHKLNEGRKVTCQLLGVILEESFPEDLQKHATVRSSVCEVLLEITKFCDLYLMERVLDDESEERVLSALDDAGLFTSGGLTREKVLFCSTENGRSSFVRQLEPDWHIDTNGEIIHQLSSSLEVQIEANVLHALNEAITKYSESKPSVAAFIYPERSICISLRLCSNIQWTTRDTMCFGS